MNKNSKKGFTLVELSIVLVIIGLLIGGILAAQSMIGTAKIQALARQIGQFDAAISNFQTKFNQLPGDNTLMGTSVAGTANNGQITDSAGVGCAAGTLNNNEIGHFWFDLSQSGLSSQGGGTYTDDSAGGTVVKAGTTIPSATAGTNAGFVPCYAAAAAPIVNAGNYYIIGTFSAANNTTAFTVGTAFKPTESLALDIKIDDGVTNAGNVAAVDAANLAPTLAPATTTTKCQSTTAGAYDVANSSAICNMAVRIGSSNGVLQ